MKITRRQFGTTGAASVAALATPGIVGRALGEMPNVEGKDGLIVHTGTGLQT